MYCTLTAGDTAKFVHFCASSIKLHTQKTSSKVCNTCKWIIFVYLLYTYRSFWYVYISSVCDFQNSSNWKVQYYAIFTVPMCTALLCASSLSINSPDMSRVHPVLLLRAPLCKTCVLTLLGKQPFVMSQVLLVAHWYLSQIIYSALWDNHVTNLFKSCTSKQGCTTKHRF